VHNLNIAAINDVSRIELNVTTPSNLTGIVAPTSPNLYILKNVGSSNMAIPQENVNSDPENRFSFAATVVPSDSIHVLYNTSTQRWDRVS
jgi:hypothetical protein